tara:strand:+ start:17 stop:712 length:696 start_codon:yes stop_codon:yes gene_type:complete
MTYSKQQPIIILGGFLIPTTDYYDMSEWLEAEIKQPVSVIDTNKFEWLLTNWAFGWKRILDHLDKEVKRLQNTSNTNKVTLIGHSSGGVMLRLYLSDEDFYGRVYKGFERVDCLITLGSPHQAEKATKLRAMVDRKYPGTFYRSKVKYISIAGDLDLNAPDTSKFSKRTAKISYKSLCSLKNAKGDGLVPIQSALLNGSNQIILDKTSHGNLFGRNWYCSKAKVEEWWYKI